MVSLNVPTISYGKKFEDRFFNGALLAEVPKAPYPGVHVSFNEVDALKVYRGVLSDESKTRAWHSAVLDHHLKPQGHSAELVRTCDLLPGYASTSDWYRKTGWTQSPMSFRPMRPELPSVTYADLGKAASKSAPSSAAGSASGQRTAPPSAGTSGSEQRSQGRSGRSDGRSARQRDGTRVLRRSSSQPLATAGQVRMMASGTSFSSTAPPLKVYGATNDLAQLVKEKNRDKDLFFC